MKLHEVEYVTEKGYIRWLRISYKDLKNNIVTSKGMGKRPEAEHKTQKFTLKESDKVLVAFSGFVQDHLLYFKLTTLQDSRVCSIGPESSRADARHVEHTLLAREFISLAKAAFKRKEI